MGYRILPTKRFEERLESALAYISSELASPFAAQALLNNVESRFRLLSNTPLAFPKDENMSERTGLVVRTTAVKNYRIYYTIDERERIVYPRTIVHRLQDSSQLTIDEFAN